MCSKAWVLCLLFLLSQSVPSAQDPEVNCDEYWKTCWAHCQIAPDPDGCYHQCMLKAGCRSATENYPT